MDEMNFESYLIKKKIDPKGFAQGEPERFREFEELFNQVHPDSFTAQKLFLINSTRRAFPLQEEEEVKVTKKPMARPKMVKPKTN
ncbi:hypothetical protein [Roseivirga misakiensis]|uniref:Uncharacterized protein n=1 Tax=Roseivirga misakiensis TaxID=1563681 RepID=A0A1E5T259_9BACT|nr:hypothetical protein [Roseivirga misakiensis]OEK05462.1 hypothetical protein BFP71_18945 [Roseivirga misakiensis]